MHLRGNHVLALHHRRQIRHPERHIHQLIRHRPQSRCRRRKRRRQVVRKHPHTIDIHRHPVIPTHPPLQRRQSRPIRNHHFLPEPCRQIPIPRIRRVAVSRLRIVLHHRLLIPIPITQFRRTFLPRPIRKPRTPPRRPRIHPSVQITPQRLRPRHRFRPRHHNRHIPHHRHSRLHQPVTKRVRPRKSRRRRVPERPIRIQNHTPIPRPRRQLRHKRIPLRIHIIA